jgi:hypothetical protein
MRIFDVCSVVECKLPFTVNHSQDLYTSVLIKTTINCLQLKKNIFIDSIYKQGSTVPTVVLFYSTL